MKQLLTVQQVHIDFTVYICKYVCASAERYGTRPYLENIGVQCTLVVTTAAL